MLVYLVVLLSVAVQACWAVDCYSCSYRSEGGVAVDAFENNVLYEHDCGFKGGDNASMVPVETCTGQCFIMHGLETVNDVEHECIYRGCQGDNTTAFSCTPSPYTVRCGTNFVELERVCCADDFCNSGRALQAAGGSLLLLLLMRTLL